MENASNRRLFEEHALAPDSQIDPAPNTLLLNPTSAGRAIVITSYPYGRLRCIMRYWLEYKDGRGTRLVSQTNNPKRSGLVWNKPHAGTYTAGAVVLVTDDEGHVKERVLAGYGVSTGNVAQCDESLELIGKFESDYGEAMQVHDLKYLQAARQYIARRRVGLETPHVRAAIGSVCPVCNNYSSDFGSPSNCTGTTTISDVASTPAAVSACGGSGVGRV